MADTMQMCFLLSSLCILSEWSYAFILLTIKYKNDQWLICHCSVLCHVVLAMLQFKCKLYCQLLCSTSLQDCVQEQHSRNSKENAKGRPNLSCNTCVNKSCTSLVHQRADQNHSLFFCVSCGKVMSEVWHCTMHFLI